MTKKRRSGRYCRTSFLRKSKNEDRKRKSGSLYHKAGGKGCAAFEKEGYSFRDRTARRLKRRGLAVRISKDPEGYRTVTGRRGDGKRGIRMYYIIAEDRIEYRNEEEKRWRFRRFLRSVKALWKSIIQKWTEACRGEGIAGRMTELAVVYLKNQGKKSYLPALMWRVGLKIRRNIKNC